MRTVGRLLQVLAVVFAAAIAASGLALLIQHWQVQVAQDRIADFYLPPNPIPQRPGMLIRSQEIPGLVPGATTLRLLYSTQRPDGQPAVSGALAFIPDGPAPAGGRRVVSWAHGTIGLGEQCAPSRTADPVKAIRTWLPIMLARGWIVVATDYAGLGTPGASLYLVGTAEARDVVNAVRAVHAVPGADAGSQYAVWGHSQGGHSALWSGALAAQLAPELDLVAVAAAAPAAELQQMIDIQWDAPVAWVIGPEVVKAWPVVDPQLPIEGIVTTAGTRNVQRISDECIKVAALEALTRAIPQQQFFARNPVTDATWAAFAREQTPAPLPPDIPLLIAQSTADDVVPPQTTASLQEAWCDAGSDLTSLWIGDVGHMATALTAGPAVAQWLDDRFAGRPASSTCDVSPPALPAASTR